MTFHKGFGVWLAGWLLVNKPYHKLIYKFLMMTYLITTWCCLPACSFHLKTYILTNSLMDLMMSDIKLLGQIPPAVEPS